MTDYNVNLRIDSSGAVRGARQFKRSANEVGKSAATAGKKLDITNTKIAKTGRSLTALRSVMAGVGFTAFAVAVSSATRAAVEFSGAMAEVGTLFDEKNFGSNIGKLSEEVKALSAEFGQNTTEQARALYQVISAGASTAAEATEILTAANKLAVGGVTDVATAADGLTSILNAYGLSASDTGRVSDQLFATMRAGKTTVGELSRTLGIVAPVAKESGVGLDELLASIAALTKSGLRTKSAVSGIRQALVNLLRPTEDAKKIMDEYNIQIDAARLKSEGFAAVMADVTAKLGGNTEAMAKLFSSTEGMVAMMSLAGSGAEDFKEIWGDVATAVGDTDDAVAKMNESASQILKVFGGNVKNAMLSLGETMLTVLLPAMKAFNENIGAVTQAFGSLTKAIVVGSGVALLTKFLPAIAATIASLVKTVVIVKELSHAYGLMVAAQKVLQVSMAKVAVVASAMWTALLGHVGLVVVAVGAAAAAFAAFQWQANRASIEAQDLATDVDRLRENFSELNESQQKKAINDATAAMAKQRTEVQKLAREVERAQKLTVVEDELDKIRKIGEAVTQLKLTEAEASKKIEREVIVRADLSELEMALKDGRADLRETMGTIEDMREVHRLSFEAIDQKSNETDFVGLSPEDVEELKELRNELDTLGAAQEKAHDSQELLNKAVQAGAISAREHGRLTNKVTEEYEKELAAALGLEDALKGLNDEQQSLNAYLRELAGIDANVELEFDSVGFEALSDRLDMVKERVAEGQVYGIDVGVDTSDIEAAEQSLLNAAKLPPSLETQTVDVRVPVDASGVQTVGRQLQSIADDVPKLVNTTVQVSADVNVTGLDKVAAVETTLTKAVDAVPKRVEPAVSVQAKVDTTQVDQAAREVSNALGSIPKVLTTRMTILAEVDTTEVDLVDEHLKRVLDTLPKQYQTGVYLGVTTDTTEIAKIPAALIVALADVPKRVQTQIVFGADVDVTQIEGVPAQIMGLLDDVPDFLSTNVRVGADINIADAVVEIQRVEAQLEGLLANIPDELKATVLLSVDVDATDLMGVEPELRSLLDAVPETLRAVIRVGVDVEAEDIYTVVSRLQAAVETVPETLVSHVTVIAQVDTSNITLAVNEVLTALQALPERVTTKLVIAVETELPDLSRVRQDIELSLAMVPEEITTDVLVEAEADVSGVPTAIREIEHAATDTIDLPITVTATVTPAVENLAQAEAEIRSEIANIPDQIDLTTALMVDTEIDTAELRNIDLTLRRELDRVPGTIHKDVRVDVKAVTELGSIQEAVTLYEKELEKVPDETVTKTVMAVKLDVTEVTDAIETMLHIIDQVPQELLAEILVQARLGLDLKALDEIDPKIEEILMEVPKELSLNMHFNTDVDTDPIDEAKREVEGAIESIPLDHALDLEIGTTIDTTEITRVAQTLMVVMSQIPRELFANILVMARAQADLSELEAIEPSIQHIVSQIPERIVSDVTVSTDVDTRSVNDAAQILREAIDGLPTSMAANIHVTAEADVSQVGDAVEVVRSSLDALPAEISADVVLNATLDIEAVEDAARELRNAIRTLPSVVTSDVMVNADVDISQLAEAQSELEEAVASTPSRIDKTVDILVMSRSDTSSLTDTEKILRKGILTFPTEFVVDVLYEVVTSLFGIEESKEQIRDATVEVSTAARDIKIEVRADVTTDLSELKRSQTDLEAAITAVPRRVDTEILVFADASTQGLRTAIDEVDNLIEQIPTNVMLEITLGMEPDLSAVEEANQKIIEALDIPTQTAQAIINVDAQADLSGIEDVRKALIDAIASVPDETQTVVEVTTAADITQVISTKNDVIAAVEAIPTERTVALTLDTTVDAASLASATDYINSLVAQIPTDVTVPVDVTAEVDIENTEEELFILDKKLQGFLDKVPGQLVSEILFKVVTTVLGIQDADASVMNAVGQLATTDYQADLDLIASINADLTQLDQVEEQIDDKVEALSVAREFPMLFIARPDTTLTENSLDLIVQMINDLVDALSLRALAGAITGEVMVPVNANLTLGETTNDLLPAVTREVALIADSLEQEDLRFKVLLNPEVEIDFSGAFPGVSGEIFGVRTHIEDELSKPISSVLTIEWPETKSTPSPEQAVKRAMDPARQAAKDHVEEMVKIFSDAHIINAQLSDDSARLKDLTDKQVTALLVANEVYHKAAPLLAQMAKETGFTVGEFRDLSPAVKQALGEFFKMGKEADKLINKYAPLHAQLDRLNEDFDTFQLIVSNPEFWGQLTEEKQAAILEALKNTEQAIQDVAGEMDGTAEVTRKATTAQASAAADWEGIWRAAAKEINTSLVDAFKGAFDGIDEFFDGIIDSFKTMLAQMAALAVQKQIIVPIFTQVFGSGGGGGIIAGLAGGAGGGAGGAGLGFGAAVSGASLASLGYQGFSSFLGGSTVGQSAYYGSLAGGGNAGGLAAGAGAGLAAAGIGALAGAIVGELVGGTSKNSTIFGIAGGVAGGILAGPLGAAFGGAVGGILAGAFGGGEKITAQGFQLSLADGEFSGNTFQSISKRGGLFGSSRRYDALGPLDPELLSTLNEAFKTGTEPLRVAAEAMGVSADALDNFTLDTEKVRLEGLDEEGVEAKLTEFLNNTIIKAYESFTNTTQGISETFRAIVNGFKHDGDSFLEAMQALGELVKVQEVNVREAADEGIRLLRQSAFGALIEAGQELTSFSMTASETSEGLVALTAGLLEFKISATDMLIQIDTLSNAMMLQTNSLRNSILDATQTEEERYNRGQSSFDTIVEQLQTAMDPTAIADLVAAGQGELRNLFFSVLSSDEQRQTLSPEYLESLDDLLALGQARLDVSAEEVSQLTVQLDSEIEANLVLAATALADAATDWQAIGQWIIDNSGGGYLGIINAGNQAYQGGYWDPNGAALRPDSYYYNDPSGPGYTGEVNG